MMTLILKGTDGCNLRCKYCSIGEKKSDFNIMNIETMKLAGDFLVKFGKERNETSFNIILHGGEPTLINYKVYQEFFDYLLQTYINVSFKFSIQTNCFHISKEYMAFFKKYDVHVGVSIDGSEKIHNKTRVDINGNGTFEKIKENIVKLVDNGVSVSGLIVVTKDLLNENLLYLNFFNYYNISLKINPLLNYGEASNENSLWLEICDYSNYLKKIYLYMLENEIEIQINPISNIFNAIVNDTKMSDCAYKNECGKNFICVDYKGDIYPCGRFYDVYGSCLGNVYNTNNILNFTPKELSNECKNCKYLKWCYGGCSAYREIMKSDKTLLCEDIKLLFDYFSDDGISAYINYLKEKKVYLNEILNEIENA